MSKVGKLFNWGLGAFQIVMKNKLVSTGCFLVTGLFHTFSPVGSLDWDTMMLSLFLMLYAVASIVFVLSNKNELVGKGKEAAEGLVHGYFKGQMDNASKGQELFSKSKKLSEHTQASNERVDERLKKLTEKKNQAGSPGKIVLVILYALLLAFAVCMFIWRSSFVNLVQIIFGVLIIADGISGILTVVAAYRSGTKIKGKIVSLIISIFTILIGAAFIILPDDAAAMTYRITGAMLIIKAVFDYIVMIRNREVLSSVKDSVNEIKNQ